MLSENDTGAKADSSKNRGRVQKASRGLCCGAFERLGGVRRNVLVSFSNLLKTHLIKQVHPSAPGGKL